MRGRTFPKWLALLLCVSMLQSEARAAVTADPDADTSLSPAAVGWGNLLVPGLGATLRGYPTRGLAEAGGEIGMYYGGTFGVREGSFTIDGSVDVPTSANLYRPLIGQFLQEAGLKLHFYDTFYNYQMAALAEASSDREKSNPQPLYKGDLGDIMKAPFEWKNISNPWVYPLIVVSGIYLVLDYKWTAVQRLNFQARPGENGLYAFDQIAAIPLGGAMGEEPLFRGMIQRETRLYTGSAVASLFIESSLFTLIHPDDEKASAFLGGMYFGIMTNHFDGNIEPAVAAHFWVNLLDGITTYWLFRRVQGLSTPFAPPLTAEITLPLPF